LLFGESGGVEHVRGPRQRLDSLELHPDGGETVFDQPPSFSENQAEQPTRGFGALGAKQQRTVTLRLGLGRWLPDDALKHVVVVLPEIGVSEEKACFRLLVHFRRSAHVAPSAAGAWAPDRLELI